MHATLSHLDTKIFTQLIASLSNPKYNVVMKRFVISDWDLGVEGS